MTVECEEPYELKGDQFVTCIEGTTFSGDLPCVPASGKRIEFLIGHMVKRFKEIFSMIRYTCALSLFFMLHEYKYGNFEQCSLFQVTEKFYLTK